MNLIDASTWQAKAAADPYWASRWRYLSVARQLLVDAGFRADARVLELGAGGLPLCTDSVRVADHRHGVADTILHDARTTPWPIPRRHYDLAIALQVYEHLDPAQRQVTAYLASIADWLLFSAPYRWPGGNELHRDRDLIDVQAWIGNPPLQGWAVVVDSDNPILVALADLREVQS